MKINKNLIILIGIVLLNLSLFSQENLQDSSKVIVDTTKFHLFDNIKLMFGAGMTTGSVRDDWEKYFDNGPVFNLGFEFPLISKNNIYFQLNYHYWISKTKYYTLIPNYYNWDFQRINDDYYSGGGFSAILKWYFIEYYFFKASTDIGIFFGGLASNNYYGEDIGISLYFDLNKTHSMSLNRKILFLLLPGMVPLSRYEVFPNQLLLNYYYRL